MYQFSEGLPLNGTLLIIMLLYGKKNTDAIAEWSEHTLLYHITCQCHSHNHITLKSDSLPGPTSSAMVPTVSVRHACMMIAMHTGDR